MWATCHNKWSDIYKNYNKWTKNCIKYKQRNILNINIMTTKYYLTTFTFLPPLPGVVSRLFLLT
jgi:hypothetical protein